MQVMHCAKKPLTVQLPARVPVISGTTEFRFPAPTRSLPPREAVTLPDETGKIVLEKWGRMGLIEVAPGTDPQAVLLEGLQKRHYALAALLTQYRELQAVNRAAGVPIQLPKAHHRAAMKEMNELAAEIAALDPVMHAELPTLKPEQVKDPILAELEAFGLAPEPVPPGAAVDIGF